MLAAAIAAIWFGAKPVSAGGEMTWDRFKEDYLSPEGRIIDFYQDQCSHSEGQGYAMLLAFQNEDRASFDRIWKWTRDNLQVRQTDQLCAWQWGQRQPGRWVIMDYNNASDGDTCIALALILAGTTWKDKEYLESGRNIVQNIRENLILNRDGLLCLLPGYHGFVKNGDLILNPSYFVWPAYKIFAQFDRQDFWEKFERSGREILKRSSFGRFKLPADWAYFDGSEFSVYKDRSKTFGYEAVRVLLYAAWEGDPKKFSEIGEYLSMIERIGYLPEWVNLLDDSVSISEAPAGFYAVFAKSARILGKDNLAKRLDERASQKIAAEPKSYYSQVLYLLSRLEVKP
jgi:endoglucanase